MVEELKMKIECTNKICSKEYIELELHPENAKLKFLLNELSVDSGTILEIARYIVAFYE